MEPNGSLRPASEDRRMKYLLDPADINAYAKHKKMKPDAILLTLLQGDSGLAWAKRRQGWSESSKDPVCSWYGIICDPADRKTVTGIFLPQSTLSGTIPPELGLLTTLRSITLSQNLIYGPIPTSVAQLPYLEVLNLADNKITGNIPVFASPYLHSLILGYNLLTGTIPDAIGRTNVAMAEFDVMHNRISGTIPESFSLMGSLSELSLSNNTLSGTIPGSLGEIIPLQYLYLDHNYLVGFIPPTLSKMGSVLEEVWLQENFLSGTLPAALSDLTKLVNLYIDGNKFTGTVPKDICSSKLNADFFSDVDESVSRDYCDSIACPAGQVAEEGVYPCTPCDDRYYNPYLGRVGHCIDINQRDILKAFYKATGGKNWADSNWDVEDSFLCTFTGVTCDNNNHVTHIKLKGMGLKGQIPEEIGFLRYLQVLDLSDNELTGFLPSDLRFAPLEVLDVSGNFFKGIVPPALCLKAGINNNGYGGDYNCENIACPAGTFSPTGRRPDKSAASQCTPCGDGYPWYLGSKSCSNPLSSGMSHGGKVVLTMFCMAFFIILPIAFIVKVGKVKIGAILNLRDEDVANADNPDMLDDLRLTVKSRGADDGGAKEKDSLMKSNGMNGKVARMEMERPNRNEGHPLIDDDDDNDDHSPDDVRDTTEIPEDIKIRPSMDGYNSGGSALSMESKGSRDSGRSRDSKRSNGRTISERKNSTQSRNSGQENMVWQDFPNKGPPPSKPKPKETKQIDTTYEDFPRTQSNRDVWLDVPAI